MKTFSQFLKEAISTLASKEAKSRGLVGDGHGDWYDKQGNLAAKTVGGKLQYFGSGGAKQPTQQEPQQTTTQQAQSQIQIQPQEKQAAPEEDEGKGVVIVVGRFNPPSRNHEALLRAGYSNAKRTGYEYRIYPSRIQDDKTNPLKPKEKISFMKSMFPNYADYIVDSDDMKTIFDILSSVYGDGYVNAVIVVGQDRLGEFQSLVHKGDGQMYQFNEIQVVSSGVKDPDSDAEDPGSSAMMRAAAAIGDIEKFFTGLPSNMKLADKNKIFKAVEKKMNVNENTELWKIIPELDYEGMRWNYKNNGLFEIGSVVENLNSGLQGKIIRKGSNHLICVTEDGIMFKSWLKDVREVMEIGTDDYLKHAQQMVPGQPMVSFSDVKIKRTIPKKKINMNSKELSKTK
jgi:hypothetical protein